MLTLEGEFTALRPCDRDPVIFSLLPEIANAPLRFRSSAPDSALTSLRKCKPLPFPSLCSSLMHPFCFRILRLRAKAGLSPPWIPSLWGHQPHSPLFLSWPLALARGLLSSASRHTEPPLLKQKHKATHKASPARPCLCSQALLSSSSSLFKRGP